MKDIDVTFVFPPGTGNSARIRPHLGVAYLQAALNRHGLRTGQFLPPNPVSATTAANAILDDNPRVVGFTVYDSNYAQCLNLARLIKAASPDTWIVFGGPTPTFAYDAVLKHQPVVDLCVRGEAEETGPFLFDYLLGAKPDRPPALTDIKGLAFRNGAGVIETGWAPLAGDDGGSRGGLDTSISSYLSGVLTDPRAGLITGRGCNQNCVYCCFAALARRKLRLHSVDRVLEELRQLAYLVKKSDHKYTLTIFDDAFTLIPKRAHELCEQLARENLGLKLSCITRADTIDHKLLATMRRAGFTAIAFGLESAVPRILRAIGKVRPPNWSDPSLDPEIDFLDRVRQSVVQAKELGFVVGVSIMLGLPSETPADGQTTMDFVEKLPIDYYMHKHLNVHAGTILSTNYNHYGIELSKGPLGINFTKNHPYKVSEVKPAKGGSELRENARLCLALAKTGLYGCGVPAGIDKPFSLVVIRSDRIDRATARWLAAHLTIGGHILQVTGDATLYQQRERLNSYRDLLEAEVVPARDLLQLVLKKANGQTRQWLLVSGVSHALEAHYPELVTMREDCGADSLFKWLGGHAVAVDTCSLDHLLSEPEGWDRLATALLGADIKKLSSILPFPPHIAHGDRLAENVPPCLSTSRIEIDGSGLVRVCRHGQPIGQVGDDPAVLRNRLEEAHKQAIMRNAAEGRTEIVLSQCPFMGFSQNPVIPKTARQQLAKIFMFSGLRALLDLQVDFFKSNV